MNIVTAALLASLAGVAEAQAPTPTPATPASPAAPAAPAAPAPKPAPELQKLAFLVGDWIHEETMQPGPLGPGGPSKGRSKAQWILGDQHLYVNYVSRNATNETTEARALLGWDEAKKAYRLDWYDNQGMAVRYSGDFAPDGALVLNAEFVSQGQAVKEQLSIRRQEDGKLIFVTSLAAPDGSWKPMFESVATAEKK